MISGIGFGSVPSPSAPRAEMWRASSMPVMPGISHVHHAATCGRLRFESCRQRLRRIGCLTNDSVRKFGSQVGQHLSQAGTGRRFVINDQD